MDELKSKLVDFLRRDDLIRASLLLGRIRDNSFNDHVYVDKLLELAAKVWNKTSRLKDDPIAKLGLLNLVLFNKFGLEGKSERYKQVIDDPDRYYIDTVLKKKVGSPLTITIIYVILAEQLGIDFEILALPASFYLKVKDEGREIFVDPFDRGRLLSEEEFQKKLRSCMQRNRMISANLFEVIGCTQLIGKLIQQLKHIYILKGNAVEALRAVEMLTVIFPDSPELTRDRGVLYCEMEYFSKAMDDLKFYLKARPGAEDVGEIKKLTSMLKGYREIVN